MTANWANKYISPNGEQILENIANTVLQFTVSYLTGLLSCSLHYNCLQKYGAPCHGIQYYSLQYRGLHGLQQVI